MGRPRPAEPSLLVCACFSRHRDLLDRAEAMLVAKYGPLALRSPDFDFHHTTYYQKTMGPDLKKRFVVFEGLRSSDILPETKLHTISIEEEAAAGGEYPESRPLNLDPGLIQLGKFLLASTKDQAHRIYLRDGIYAEVTLRYRHDEFEVWPWTYADYRESAVRQFLKLGRGYLYKCLRT